MADGYYNLIQFVIEDRSTGVETPGEANTVFRALNLELEGTFVWRAGIEPGVYSFRCPWDEFERLGGNADREGELRFYFSAAAGAPDWRIKRMRIVDVKPLEIGLDSAQVRRVLSYRLLIADLREGWVWPRGGNLRVMFDYGDEDPSYSSKVNPEGTPSEKLKSNSQLMEACLAMMGVAGYTIDPGVDDVPPIRELEWKGNHAPAELQKLLEHCGAVLALQTSGRVIIDRLGSGPGPSVPDGQRLGDDLVLPSVDRRPTTVVVSSEPSPVINTQTLMGPASDTWQFVAMDFDGSWKPLEQLYDLLAGRTPAQVVQEKFVNVPALYRERARQQFYRCIRLSGDAMAVRVLRTLWLKQDGQIVNRPILVKGLIANVAEDGTWRNETVECAPAYLHEDSRRGLAVIQMVDRLGKVRTDGVSDPEAEFAEAAASSIEVRVSREMMAEADGKVEHAYYQAGYRWNGSAAVQLNPTDLRNALAGGREAWVIQRPELVEYRLDGETQNVEELNEIAQGIAARHLKYALVGETKLTTVMGWCRAELSGKVSEIHLTQKPSMEIRQNTWFAPASAVRMDLFRKAQAGEKYPGQIATAGRGIASGADGWQQPVVPLMPATAATAAGDTCVLVKITSTSGGAAKGGKYVGVILRGASRVTTTGKLQLPGGMTELEANTCLVCNVDEDGLPTHWIQVGSYVLGKITGRTADDGVPEVMAISGRYRIDSPKTLGVSDAWDRDVDDKPLELLVLSRVAAWDAEEETQTFGVRRLLIDAGGKVHDCGAESGVSLVLKKIPRLLTGAADNAANWSTDFTTIKDVWVFDFQADDTIVLKEYNCAEVWPPGET